MSLLNYESLEPVKDNIVVIDIYGKFVIPTFLCEYDDKLNNSYTNYHDFMDLKSLAIDVYKRWLRCPLDEYPSLVIFDSKTKRCTNYNLDIYNNILLMKDGQPFEMIDGISNTVQYIKREIPMGDYSVDPVVTWLKLMVTEKVAKTFEFNFDPDSLFEN